MSRDAFLPHVHPRLRTAIIGLEGALQLEGIPLKVYEAARTPWRQAELYARGRGVGPTGRTVTRARSWESMHNYGLAVDYVFNIDGKWTWEEPKPGLWDDFHKIAKEYDLRPLSFEKPHVELACSLTDLQAGRFPAGGDRTWEEWLEGQIEMWGQEAKRVNGIIHPAGPPIHSLDDRPFLDAVS